MELKVYNPIEWIKYAEDAHFITFNEHRPSHMNRIDFALVCFDVEPLGYMTCKEFDNESVYIGYGGSFQKTFKVFKAYQLFLSYLKERYVRAVTLVENTNEAMIKLAMSQGFLITGIRYHKNIILLEMTNEWSK